MIPNQAAGKTNKHLDAFLKVVRSPGVSLPVYKVNAKWEWTSLLGGEKKILLRKLPSMFEQILPPNKVEKTRQLWTISVAESLLYLNKTLHTRNITLHRFINNNFAAYSFLSKYLVLIYRSL